MATPPISTHQPPAGARLREAHAHVYQHGRSMGMVDLSSCDSPASMLEAIAERRRERIDKGLTADVLAHGARPESWDPPRWPGLADLDRVVPDGVLIAWCFDYHALAANTRGLALAGFAARSADPAGGILGRDGAGGLNGVVYETAAQMVWDAAPEPAMAERRAIVRTALVDLARHGFVEVHDLKAQPWLPGVLHELDGAGELAADVVLFPLLEDAAAMAGSRSAWETGRVRLGGAKIFVDGTLNSRTAWMLEPFADGMPGHPCGTPMMTRGAIAQSVARCAAMGLALRAHAIGDGAVRAVLDAVEAGPRLGGASLEHAEFVHPDDIVRFARLGVVCSVQPCHMLYDIEALRRATPDRLDRVLPLRSLIDAGCVPGTGLVFGSDTPIVRPDPGDSLQAAIERRRAGEPPESAIGLEESITLEESLACFVV